jgi:hypothetical protein
MPRAGFEPRSGPSNQAAADLHLGPRGHWDRLICSYRLIFHVNKVITEMCVTHR